MEDRWDLEDETLLNRATSILNPNEPIVTGTTNKY